MLFASGNPLSIEKLSEILQIDRENIIMLLASLKEDLMDESRGLTIVEVAGGYQLCTKPELASIVEKLAVIQDNRLSVAAMETLAIIAFKQPITKQEIEALRGVKADRVVNTLVERRLVRELGRKEAIGRPILYGTTDEFLKYCGLKTIKELPALGDFLASNEPESKEQS